MRLRTRLALAISAVLLLTLVLVGLAFARSTRSTLIDQVDQQVINNAIIPRDDDQADQDQSAANPPGVRESTPVIDDDEPVRSTPTSGGSTDTFRREGVVGHFVYTDTGVLLIDEPAGFVDSPPPLPALPEIPGPAIDALVDTITTLPSTDGSMDYRVLVQQSNDGNFLVTAAPLDEVDQVMQDLERIFLILGSLALLGSTGAAWWLIRQGLKPVDSMIQTATAIASGDLSLRVPEVDQSTELGQLGLALNKMLVQIEDGVAIRVETEERLRRFIGDAAHELRTPLTSVQGYAELYRSGALTNPEDVNRAMGRIESEGNRMARLVDDLLLLARLDQQRPIERKPVDLANLVRESIADFRVVSPAIPVDFEGPEEAIVIGDAVRLRQVLDNLLTNARVHTPAGTSISLNLKQNDQQTVLSVCDTGPGIDPDVRTRIFERFWRGDPARTRGSGGTGLGLAIVAAIVAAHCGTITVDSTLGNGACFSITFPDADNRVCGSELPETETTV